MESPNIRNNVAAMIHRHSSPARGWHRCKLQPVWLNGITQYNEKRFTICRYKYKRTTIPALRAGWRQIAAATGVYHNWGDTIHPHRFNTQPAARYVANITCADEWYDPIYGTKCSGVDPTPSSPARGWLRGMLRIRTSNEWPYGQWRQIAAATVGCTMFWVVPFTPTGSTSNVAGGRLPPLHQNCYKCRIFNVTITVLRFKKCEKRGTLP